MKAELSHLRPTPLDSFLFGVCYYPEHWDADTRREDALRMREAGINVVRMAEFASELMETQPGAYTFELFDEVIDELGSVGISTILGTPTAAPPRWFSLKNPDAVIIDSRGNHMQHGSRQHISLSHPKMREYSRNITRAMAEHFAENPHVIGWQTDNEFHCHISEDHSPAAAADFQGFLRGRYGTIDALNQAWGNRFWSLGYQDFDEIITPRLDRPTHPNPSLQLDYARFLSWRVTRFQKEQVDIIRKAHPQAFVFHNGCFSKLDYRGDFTRDLDFLGYDSYPMFSFDAAPRAANHAFNLDRTRAWSGNFIIPEHQSGAGGQAPYSHDQPEPGELRRMTYTSLAHGADGILYFRWRTCRYGAEMYWCGILDHDNIPRRRYEEVKEIGRELAEVGPQLLGSHVVIDAAVAMADYEAMELHETTPFGLPGLSAQSERIHAWFFHHQLSVGCVHPEDELSGLKLFILPHWELVKPEWIEVLTRFVENGGTLVVGARSGTRTINNHVITETAPGLLRDLCGVEVRESSRKNRSDQRPWILKWGDQTHTAQEWVEILDPLPGTKTLARWDSRYATGETAVSLARRGGGQVLYVGTGLTDEWMANFGPELCKLADVHPLLSHQPNGVEVVRRQKEDQTFLFLLNHSDESCLMPEIPTGEHLIGGLSDRGGLELPPNGVALIQT